MPAVFGRVPDKKRARQRRIQREENAEEQCGKRSQYRRHAAESAQTDIDPRDAGYEETEAECATDQGPAAHSPVAAGFLTQKDE